MVDAVLLNAVRLALVEDCAHNDVTTRLLESGSASAVAAFVAEERLVVCGIDAVSATISELYPPARFESRVGEGEWADAGATLVMAHAAAGPLLSAERVALNFLQRLSGIATATRRAVDAVAGTAARITHTRKTTPGLRALEIRAVLAGGGVANRSSLADAVLWKDNHWALLGRQDGSLERALSQAPPGTDVIVEVESMTQLEEALAAGVRHVLVDNQTPERLAEFAGRAGRGITIQASGGITGQNVRAYAEAGADLIAIGALTHSAAAGSIRCDVATV